MSGGFAGRLRAKVGLLRRAEGRDALGAPSGAWEENGVVWTSVEPLPAGPEVVGDALDAAPRWRLTMRPCDVRVGDRIEWVTRTLTVRAVIEDPALPDRVVAIGEQER